MMRRAFSLLPLPLFALTLALAAAPARAQQSPQVIPLWPHGTPEPAQTAEPEKDVTTDKDALISGHRTARLANVTVPTMTVYLPPANLVNSGAAALVFPGGGYVRLAWDGEGTDVCRWLNSLAMTCLLVKYRVPETGRYPENPADLEDAQQAMRLARKHAAEWHINPKHIGVIGFSAGGNLAALLSTHPDDTHVLSTPAAADVDPTLDARANFAILGYPAYLISPEGSPNAAQGHDTPTFPTLNPTYMPNQFTPPTFLVQAENDRGYGRNAPAYYEALAAAAIPSELIMYPNGGHGFGMHPAGRAPEHWSRLAADFLRETEMIPAVTLETSAAGSGSTINGMTAIPGNPCAVPGSQPPAAGRPDKNTRPSDDPICW